MVEDWQNVGGGRMWGETPDVGREARCRKRGMMWEAAGCRKRDRMWEERQDIGREPRYRKRGRKWEERQDVGREAGCGSRKEDETLRSFLYVLEGGLGLLSIPAVDRTFIHTVIYVRYIYYT
jgi:hypothetical protein